MIIVAQKRNSRTWILTAGAYALPGKFKTEAAALEALAANPGFYRYWAGSIGASVANSTPQVVKA
jgi:hypothetical protein